MIIFWTKALENTVCYRRHKKDVIVGNTGFVSLPSHPNVGKLLPALLTFTPLEIAQTTILLQAAKKGEGIWKQWWKLAVKKHALSRDLFWVRWQNICLQARRACEASVGRAHSGAGRLQILRQLVWRLSRACAGDKLLLSNQQLSVLWGMSNKSAPTAFPHRVAETSSSPGLDSASLSKALTLLHSVWLRSSH